VIRVKPAEEPERRPLNGSELLEQRDGLLVAGKLAFVSVELLRVGAFAAPGVLDRVLEMQHLVIEDVLDEEARDLRLVEDAADHDGVMDRVPVTERAA